MNDTERLDWLQANQQTVWKCSHIERRPTTRTDGIIEHVMVFDGWCVGDDDDPKPTIREAIDDAANWKHAPHSTASREEFVQAARKAFSK